MFFKKKIEPVKDMVVVSGNIDRVSTYVAYNDMTTLIFTLKQYDKLFYCKYAWPKQTLTKENDSVTFKVEKGMPTNKYYSDEMVEVDYMSFKNLSF